MSIPKFTKLVTTAVPLPIENVDTDQIIPARFLKAVERKGFGDNLFRDWRYDKAGKPVAGFPLNDSRFGGDILVAAKNFGCGSSREHAPIAIQAATRRSSRLSLRRSRPIRLRSSRSISTNRPLRFARRGRLRLSKLTAIKRSACSTVTTMSIIC